jgi:hypothetical protein
MTKKRPECFVADENDAIAKLLTNCYEKVIPTSIKELKLDKWHPNTPVVVRGLTERKVMQYCLKTERTFYYIYTGYMCNLQKRKDWHRVVKNDVQHFTPRYDLPDDRFNRLPQAKEKLRFRGWKNHDGPILVVTPSEKPCMYYGITRDQWLTDTMAELKKHTDRKIIIRDKPGRLLRVGDNSVPAQIDRDQIYALVTYNSIAATEAISSGIPAIATAPGAADAMCTKNISNIENPYRPDNDKVIAWQNWLAYCNFNTAELSNGKALGIIEELELC